MGDGGPSIWSSIVFPLIVGVCGLVIAALIKYVFGRGERNQ